MMCRRTHLGRTSEESANIQVCSGALRLGSAMQQRYDRGAVAPISRNRGKAMAMEVRTIVTTHNAGGEAVVKTVRRNCYSNRLTGAEKMKIKAKFASIFVSACIVVFLSPPAFARPVNPPQDQGAAPTQSKGKEQKVERSPGKEIGKGGEDVGKGAGKGAESLGKGTAGAAGNLVTLHPGKAAIDLGKGAGGAGKDIGVGTGKGAAKIGKGSARGIGKLGKKIFGKGGKNKKNSDLEN